MNIVLLGAQGAGKGVIADYLSSQYGYKHISTGQLLRDEISTGSDLGKHIASIINKGMLAPDEIVFSALEKAMDGQGNYILDGFPRNIAQAKKLNTFAKIDLVIFVDAPKNLLIERLTSRRFCPRCKANYSLLTHKSNLCNKCGDELKQRDDDVPDAINKRLEIFYENIDPILNYYKEKNILQKIDNSGELQKTYKQLEIMLNN